MAAPRQTDLRDRLLRAMSADDFLRLAPHLELIDTPLREYLA